MDKSCVFCLCEMNSVHNAEKLISCPKCGNLFHNNCWFDEYLKHKNKSNETPIINNTNLYSHFVFNPNLLTPVRSEANNLYIGSRLLSNPRSPYILYPTNHIFIPN